MAEDVNDGTENVSKREINAVLQANHGKPRTDGMDPDGPKDSDHMQWIRVTY